MASRLSSRRRWPANNKPALGSSPPPDKESATVTARVICSFPRARRYGALKAPLNHEGEFVTELFERYRRITGDVEGAILER